MKRLSYISLCMLMANLCLHKMSNYKKKIIQSCFFYKEKSNCMIYWLETSKFHQTTRYLISFVFLNDSMFIIFAHDCKHSLIATRLREYRRTRRNCGGLNATQWSMIMTGGSHPQSIWSFFPIASVAVRLERTVVYRNAEVKFNLLMF